MHDEVPRYVGMGVEEWKKESRILCTVWKINRERSPLVCTDGGDSLCAWNFIMYREFSCAEN